MTCIKRYVMRRGVVLATVALALCAPFVGAQQNASPAAGEGQRRAALDREFRARGEQLVRERLNLSPDQLKRLLDVNARMDARRKPLLDQERTTRVALRQELARGSAADQPRVAQLMNQSRDLQQQRFELQQEEQRQMSAFLTPVQQAQYFGLQAQLRQKMREMRQAQDNGQAQPQSQPRRQR